MATTANATTTVYTPSVSAVVSNIRVATTGTAGTVNVFLDPSGAAGPRRGAVKDKSLGVKELFVVKPEITMGPGDSILMIDWLPQHPCRPRFKWIAYVPLDAAPFYPPWEGLLRDMEEVVAMSNFGRAALQAGVPSKRIHRIYHGVDTRVFRPMENRAALKDHERFRGKFVMGCVARSQPRKNIPALVQAFARLAREHDKVHLCLHTSPCDVGYDLVTLLRRYRLEGRADVRSPDLSLTEALAHEELNRLYNVFEVMALPTMGEGFGLPIIESLAAGVPVLATIAAQARSWCRAGACWCVR